MPRAFVKNIFQVAPCSTLIGEKHLHVSTQTDDDTQIRIVLVLYVHRNRHHHASDTEAAHPEPWEILHGAFAHELEHVCVSGVKWNTSPGFPEQKKGCARGGRH